MKNFLAMPVQQNVFFKNLLFKLISIGFAFICTMHPIFSQSNNIGSPPVKNFSKKAYHAGTQNWQIAQDGRGVVYAANNDGLLEFDGNHWRLYPLPNGTILRSFAIADNNRIYVGGQAVIGYFEGNEKGVLTFHSLNQHLPEEHKVFADVWDILIDDGNVYFMSWQMIAKWNDKEMQVSSSDDRYWFLDKIDNRFYVQHGNGDLGFSENLLSAPFDKLANFTGKITSMLAYHPDSLFITTENGKIFQLNHTTMAPWPVPNDPFFKNNVIYSSATLPNGNIVLGSTAAGVAILDKKWRILQQISKANDLQNNTVLSVYANENGNIWVGLDNGVTFIQASSALTEFFPDGDLEGTCYSSVIYEGHLYTAANTGIYKIPWKPYYQPQEKSNFSKIENSGGQVWSLDLHDGLLLAGHQRGAFFIEKNRAIQVSDLIGVWRYLPYGESHLVAGHYGGLALFEKASGQLSYRGTIDGLVESSRLLAFDNGHVWMAHPYRGIYRNRLDVSERKVESTYFNSQHGLPSDFNNRLFPLNNKTVFVGEKGVFKYEEPTSEFVPDDGFNEIFGKETQVKYLRQDADGNIWFAAGEEAGVLWITDLGIDKSIRKMVIPELADKLVNNFEFILPIDDQNVLFASEKGMIHFDPTQYKPGGNKTSIVLSEVWLKGRNDSLLFGGHKSVEVQMSIPELNHNQNALEFTFSSTNHEEQEFVKYASLLEGSEKTWSHWNSNTTLSINNLRPGKYTLLVKAKNKAGQESEPTKFSFTINPPWYASTLAYSFYGFLLISAFIGSVLIQNKKYKKERAILESTHLEEQEKKEFLVQQSKEKINELEKQKLEAEVKFKNQELAAATMNLLQKSEMLSSIEASLEKMKKSDGTKDAVYGEINRLLKLVKKENNLSDDWERFSKHFDSVHSDFLKQLGEKYPNLSPNDFKLSAYLKMNLSTKEIASLMNISIRGVEASRYRLRKRLQLDSSVNLTEFLMKL